MHDDFTLLQHYANEGDEAAFAELVRRHVNLVWGAAHRITQDADLAKDIAQTVFADLARKAGRLPTSTIVAGWLYRSSTHAAHTAVRNNTRRQRRETLAMTDQTSTQEPESAAATALQPIVDEAIESLPEADRNAVLLRYFSGKNFAQIGALTGVSDDAAQKRVSRALDKLRAYFLQRGVDVTQGAVAAGLGIAAAHAAPPGAASLFSSAAITAATSASHSFIATLISMKTCLVIAIATAAVVLSTSMAVVQTRHVTALRQQNAALRAESDALNHRLADVAAGGMPGASPGMALANADNVVVAGTRPALMPQNGRVPQVKLSGNEQAQLRQIANNLKQVGLAARIYGVDHNNQWPTTFEQMKSELALNQDGTFSDGTPLSQFEFFPQPRVISQEEPNLILFRQKDPVELGGARWARVYCYVDGSVITRTQTNPDFSKYELEGTASGDTAATAQNTKNDALTPFRMDPVLAKRYGLLPAGGTTDPAQSVKGSQNPNANPTKMDPVLARRYGLPAGSLSKPSKQPVEMDPPQDTPK